MFGGHFVEGINSMSEVDDHFLQSFKVKYLYENIQNLFAMQIF